VLHEPKEDMQEDASSSSSFFFFERKDGMQEGWAHRGQRRERRLSGASHLVI